jgi:flagellar protein FliS
MLAVEKAEKASSWEAPAVEKRMTPPNPHHEYLASRVAAATPVELTRMLFEGAAQAVQEAITAHQGGDILARGNAVTKAVQILGELRFSLRRDVAPQYCDTLSGLYGYLQSRLIQAHAEKSASMLQEVLQLIQTLLEGWIGAMRHLRTLEGPSQNAALSQDAALSHNAAPSQDAERASAGTAGDPNALNPFSSPYSSPSYSSTTPAAEPQNRSWEF